MDPTKLIAYNNRLRDLFGLYYDGHPLYRLVWSDSQIEKRFGTWQEWAGDIFIREFTGIKEVPKYPYAAARWILERREGHIPNPELPEQICYEPKWVFENEEGPVDPEWWAIEHIIHAINNPRKRSLSDDIANKNLTGSPANLEAEKVKIADAISEDLSDIQSALRFGEGVVKPVDTENGEVVNGPRTSEVSGSSDR